MCRWYDFKVLPKLQISLWFVQLAFGLHPCWLYFYNAFDIISIYFQITTHIIMIWRHITVLKIRTIFYNWDLRNYQGLVNSCVYYARETRESYQVLPYSIDLKAAVEIWNQLSKTVFSKCSFVWNKGIVNIWNDRKAKGILCVGPVNKFLFFLHCLSYIWIVIKFHNSNGVWGCI